MASDMKVKSGLTFALTSAICMLLAACASPPMKPSPGHLQALPPAPVGDIPEPVRVTPILPKPKPTARPETYSVVVNNVDALVKPAKNRQRDQYQIQNGKNDHSRPLSRAGNRVQNSRHHHGRSRDCHNNQECVQDPGAPLMEHLFRVTFMLSLPGFVPPVARKRKVFTWLRRIRIAGPNILLRNFFTLCGT